MGLGCPGNLRDALKHLGWASPYAMEDEDLLDALGLEERCWSLQDIYFFLVEKKTYIKRNGAVFAYFFKDRFKTCVVVYVGGKAYYKYFSLK